MAETSSTSSNPQATATPTSQGGRTASPNSSAAPPVKSQVTLIIIILSAVLIFAVIGLIIGIFISCHQKWKRYVLGECKTAV